MFLYSRSVLFFKYFLIKTYLLELDDAFLIGEMDIDDLDQDLEVDLLELLEEASLHLEGDSLFEGSLEFLSLILKFEISIILL